MLKLEKIVLKGYKSYGGKDAHAIPFGDVTVFIGANGSGKSNLVSVFKLLNHAFTRNLQGYVNLTDPASFFFEGPKKTPLIDLSFHLKDEKGVEDDYSLKFGFGNPNRILVMSEEVRYSKPGAKKPQQFYLSPSYPGELAIHDECDNPTTRFIYNVLSRIRAYQFHDTSDGARIKLSVNVRERYLRYDGGNLPAVLYRMKLENPKHYDRICRHIRAVMPQFNDFDLVPDVNGNVLLNWRMVGDGDGIYGPHQISDGSLRFMALATLLMQPRETLPSMVVIDEPELGLHPAAIAELAGMVRMASEASQVVLATQSPLLLNAFAPEETVVIEWDKQQQCSICRKLDEKQLEVWLEEYSLSELWEMNLLGGRP